MNKQELGNGANLQIRQNDEAGSVTAEIVFKLGGEVVPATIHVATLNMAAAVLDRKVYDAFVAMAKLAIVAFTDDMAKSLSKSTGAKIRFGKPMQGKRKEMN